MRPTVCSWHAYNLLPRQRTHDLCLPRAGAVCVAAARAGAAAAGRRCQIRRSACAVQACLDSGGDGDSGGLAAAGRVWAVPKGVACAVCAHRACMLSFPVSCLQVALLNVAAAAKGLDLPFILSTAASQQQQLAATAQQQLLAAAAATASKGMELQTILAAAAAQQQQVAATAQQQLLAAAAAAAAAGAAAPGTTPAAPSAPGLAAPTLNSEAAAAVVAAALSHHDGHSHRGSSSGGSHGASNGASAAQEDVIGGTKGGSGAAGE